MKFRPCIDIHGGAVKQIVGGSITDSSDKTEENFVSTSRARDYARMYARDGLVGGHIILLDKKGSEGYNSDLEQASEALSVAKGTMQIGGGVDPTNAEEFLDMGASHVIVTSYVFADGQIHYDRIDELKYEVGRAHLVLDLSVRKRDGDYYVVTDRWQKFTKHRLDADLINDLSYQCDEFLIHAVDVEGKVGGIDENLLTLLSQAKNAVITYAGGIHTYDDIETIRRLGQDKIDYTIGSALDIFGGELSYKKIAKDDLRQDSKYEDKGDNND